MNVTVLKDVLVSAGRLEDYFDGVTPTNLWRALNKKSDADIFGFVESPIVFSNGRPRPADIKVEEKYGSKWISVKEQPRGVSTFDKPGLPKGKGWEYFKIPKGTVIPEGLAIVKDQYNSKFEATHYTIAPAYDMPLDEFKAWLKLFATKLVKEAV